MQPLIYEGIEYRPWNHRLAVSRSGNVIRIKSRTFVNPRRRKDGYLEVAGHFLLHRMVALLWLEQPEDAKHVHHIDHDKAHNDASNLEWVTPKQHIAERHEGQYGHYERTESTRQKLREYRLGRKHSEETKQKQREANLRLGIKPPPRALGYKCSALAIDKMRKNSPNAVGCEINGTRYRSFGEAGRALGMRPHTLRKRCLSGSFSGYRIIKSGCGVTPAA